MNRFSQPCPLSHGVSAGRRIPLTHPLLDQVRRIERAVIWLSQHDFEPIYQHGLGGFWGDDRVDAWAEIQIAPNPKTRLMQALGRTQRHTGRDGLTRHYFIHGGVRVIWVDDPEGGLNA